MHLIIALLAHEVSHVFSAILLNIEFTKVKITIFGFNLNANLDRISPAKKIILFFAGPAFNLCLYFGFRNTEYFKFANMSLFLAYINLIPIVPLDGGNICKTVLEVFLDTRTVSGYITMTNAFFILYLIIIIHVYKNYLYFLLVCMGLKGIVDENRYLLEKSVLNKYHLIKAEKEKNL
jgi:stage IV sporulation protein FB